MNITISDIPADTFFNYRHARWSLVMGEYAATGICATSDDARMDARRFLTGRRVRVLYDVHWTDDDNVECITPGPCTGVISAVDFRDSVTIIDIHLDAGGYFTHEHGADGDVVELTPEQQTEIFRELAEDAVL